MAYIQEPCWIGSKQFFPGDEVKEGDLDSKEDFKSAEDAGLIGSKKPSDKQSDTSVVDATDEAGKIEALEDALSVALERADKAEARNAELGEQLAAATADKK